MTRGPGEQRTERDRPPRPHDGTAVGRARPLVLVLGWLGVLVGVGYLLGGPLARCSSRARTGSSSSQDERTPTCDDLTHRFSQRRRHHRSIIGTAFVVGVMLRLVWKRWLETLLVWAAVALQSAVFLTTTAAGLARAARVEKLDPAPPTSSFPSGHTGAATALYLSLGLVLASHVRSRGGRVAGRRRCCCSSRSASRSRASTAACTTPPTSLFGALNGTSRCCVVRQAVLGWREDDAARPTAEG